MLSLGESIPIDWHHPSPHFDGTSPHFDGISPHFYGISPHFDGISPHFDGISPHFDRINPHFDGIDPRRRGLILTMWKVLPYLPDIPRAVRVGAPRGRRGGVG